MGMHGKNRIGNVLSARGSQHVLATAAMDNDPLDGIFFPAEQDEIEESLRKADQAFQEYKSVSPEQRADFIDEIAAQIMELGDDLIDRAHLESGLPKARLIGERTRTINQLRGFANLTRQGGWVEPTIETALPNREPLPKPDLRKMLVPIGPVVVFTASNFPLALSTAGADTVSALAAGNPVIVKAHEGHLGTNELVSDAIANAAQKHGMPDGIYSSLIGKGHCLGTTLVQHDLVKAVAFTGSYGGGKALWDLATKRKQPIPFFAEMGSINPVILLPAKLSHEAKDLAATLCGSINLGVGQFCTKPGLIIAMRSNALDEFKAILIQEVSKVEGATMLNQSICENHRKMRSKSQELAEVQVLVEPSGDDSGNQIRPMLAQVTAAAFIQNKALQEEVFGPFAQLVICDDEKELESVIGSLEGQLTTTFMATESDMETYAGIIRQATDITGRLILNNAPTGVEVCPAMHHGGPFPATTDSRFTSMGTDAIKRFARPVCFQNFPDNLLPEALKNDNPLNVIRKVNGELTRERVGTPELNVH